MTDGCGKTTLVNLFAKRLEEYDIKYYTTKQPGGSESIGQKIRNMLLHENSNLNLEQQALLFWTDRIALMAEIRPMLAEGINVICDRHSLSSRVYQHSYLPPVWANMDMALHASGSILVPDVQIILDASEETVLERNKDKVLDNIESTIDEKDIREKFRLIAEQNDKIMYLRTDGLSIDQLHPSLEVLAHSLK